MERTRRRKGSRAIDLSEFRELVESLSPAPSLTYGVVFRPRGESSHAEIGDDDVLVHVLLMPHETPVLARLFTSAAGAGAGVWKVPREGAEVLVALPGDDVEAGPVIVAVSATGSVPTNLDDSNMTIDNPDGDVIVQGGSKKVSRVDDTVDLGTFSFTPSSGTGVTAGTLVWTPPGGGDPKPVTSGGVDLTGKISSGADKFKA